MGTDQVQHLPSRGIRGCGVRDRARLSGLLDHPDTSVLDSPGIFSGYLLRGFYWGFFS